MCHRLHGVLVNITKHEEQKKLDIGHEKPPTTPTWRFGLNRPFQAFAENFYIFIFAGVDPTLFIFKSSTQQQSWRAYKIGQFCHQGRPSICLCSKVRDRARTAFELAPKWEKAANRRFCKFDSIQPYPTQRQLDWSTLMFIKSSFLGYPTCLLFGHVVWWSTSLWTARTTRRRRPGRSLRLGYITSVGIFFTSDMICCSDCGWPESFLYFQHSTLGHVCFWSTTPWRARTS